ncbi:MAG: hypothetical protein TR69_WS6001000952 [candidate division WS6 bacterium OLB20]|uniref:Uncharacterized protein n=1 Tax=candidate division WS6 bacterium OLB20 TaxID=1617426 RepID=A0A136LZ45_9BACT|nr:MAG: hypothetical protein TR69_WS6001000952 [candidate division WS6 bacterium OLB20]
MKAFMHSSRLPRIVILGILSTMVITVFGLFMAAVASVRNDVANDNYLAAYSVYSGPIEQKAPVLTDASGEEYNLKNTDSGVSIQAAFVKKGLALQPAFRNVFRAQYTFAADSVSAGSATFRFPLPVELDYSELSNVEIWLDDEQLSFTREGSAELYGTQSLVWSGPVKTSDPVFTIRYETVGMSSFTYSGSFTEHAQDFSMIVTIEGTRSYNINYGMSVDSREFGSEGANESVRLEWHKENLFSQPVVSVSVGDRINPSTQVSRIYLTMAPVYVIFAGVAVFLTDRFGRGMRLLDFGIMTVLFAVFFPLVHYLSSFTIDPTMELFASLPVVMEYSMPLYLAFAVAWVLTGGLMLYLSARVHGVSFALRYMLPVTALFIGFFPLVVTIPEYAMLLVLLGFVAFMAIVVQSRSKLKI